MHVQTRLKPSEYERFKRKAEQCGLTEAAAARAGILIFTYTPTTELEKKTFIANILAVAKEIFEAECF